MHINLKVCRPHVARLNSSGCLRIFSKQTVNTAQRLQYINRNILLNKNVKSVIKLLNGTSYSPAPSRRPYMIKGSPKSRWLRDYSLVSEYEVYLLREERIAAASCYLHLIRVSYVLEMFGCVCVHTCKR